MRIYEPVTVMTTPRPRNVIMFYFGRSSLYTSFIP